jgi:uncharacterized protein (TIGR02646 family)
MIRVAFEPPRFECEVEDLGGNWLVELHAAADEHALRSALEARVARGGLKAVHSVKAYDFETRWRARARAATQRAIAARSKPVDAEAAVSASPGDKPRKPFEFESRIWSELKDHLLRLFHHKCAYCEAYFDHVDFGDVEHYRPKKRVEGEPTHPGYYWMAYDERNLLPSCKLCNQARGKMNQFPVAGTRAVRPEDDLHAEEALLLNPYQDDPAEHLHFVPRLGTVAAKSRDGQPSPKGVESWRAYNLNRERLIEFRRREQQNVRQSVSVALVREDSAALTQAVEQCLTGRQQFSSASMAEIEQYFAQFGLPVPVPERAPAMPASQLPPPRATSGQLTDV